MHRGHKGQLTAQLRIILQPVLLLLILGLSAWLLQTHRVGWDWSSGGLHSLHPTSRVVLDRLETPLRITSYTQENSQLREQIMEQIRPYLHHNGLISFSFVNPNRQPEQTRRLGIQVSGELVLTYQGRTEKLRTIDEQGITNAIQRLIMQGERWLVSITGHGERRFDKTANHDLSELGDELQIKGYGIQSLDLSRTLQIPDNTDVVVLAGPRTAMLSGESDRILNYLQAGGNMLILLDPADENQSFDLKAMLGTLDIRLLPGTVVDTSAASLGLDDPGFAIVPEYPPHPVTRDVSQLSLYPYAAAIELEQSETWIQTPILTTLERAWNETGPIRGTVEPDPELGEMTGERVIGVALERRLGDKEQRVIVTGDGDFLSNAFLGNGANLDIGLRMLRWLAGDDRLLNIPARTSDDIQLNIPVLSGKLIGLGFLILLPSTFFITGLRVWYLRRQRR